MISLRLADHRPDFNSQALNSFSRTATSTRRLHLRAQSRGFVDALMIAPFISALVNSFRLKTGIRLRFWAYDQGMLSRLS